MAAWLQNLLKLSSSVCVLDSVSSEECEETESNECEPIASILDALWTSNLSGITIKTSVIMSMIKEIKIKLMGIAKWNNAQKGNIIYSSLPIYDQLTLQTARMEYYCTPSH